jgi:hypothetical protein
MTMLAVNVKMGQVRGSSMDPSLRGGKLSQDLCFGYMEQVRDLLLHHGTEFPS